MTTYTCVLVRPRFVSGAIVAMMLLGGCTPRNISWMDHSTIVQPMQPQARAPEEPHGYLVIAVPPNVGEPGDQEVQHYPPVYVYDKQGHYLEQLPNNTEDPTALPPGDYIVLVGETDPMGEFHQVQVHVSNGGTTAVSLSNVAQAPTFWALSRALSH